MNDESGPDNDPLIAALKHPNVQAFLKMLRYGEGTSGVNGYRVMFGGQLFDNGFADHPRKAISANLGGKPITSTAAGGTRVSLLIPRPASHPLPLS